MKTQHQNRIILIVLNLILILNVQLAFANRIITGKITDDASNESFCGSQCGFKRHINWLS
jgi:hypothetical protein